MNQRKIPISMNEKEYRTAEQLAQRFGMNANVYGWFPKTVKASIKLNLVLLDLLASFIPVMNDAELDFLLQSVKVSVKAKELREQAQNAQNESKKYNSNPAESIAQLYQSQKRSGKN